MKKDNQQRLYKESKTQWFFPEENMIIYKAATARRKGFSPIDYTQPMYLFGAEIFAAGFDYNECINCDESDWDAHTEHLPNTQDKSVVIMNAPKDSFLIEYPRKSLCFWCPLCFIWNHDRKTVNRILGADPNLPHHDEPAADEHEKRIQVYGE